MKLDMNSSYPKGRKHLRRQRTRVQVPHVKVTWEWYFGFHGGRRDPTQRWAQPLLLYFVPSSASCPLTSVIGRLRRPLYAVEAVSEPPHSLIPRRAETPNSLVSFTEQTR